MVEQPMRQQRITGTSGNTAADLPSSAWSPFQRRLHRAVDRDSRLEYRYLDVQRGFRMADDEPRSLSFAIAECEEARLMAIELKQPQSILAAIKEKSLGLRLCGKRSRTNCVEFDVCRHALEGQNYTRKQKNEHGRIRPLNGRLWKPGESGNPNGRPVGSRNQFSNAFMADLSSVWDEHGKTAMEFTAKTQPAVFFATAARVAARRAAINRATIPRRSRRDGHFDIEGYSRERAKRW
jgi:Family of unknown function (DUF5681)